MRANIFRPAQQAFVCISPHAYIAGNFSRIIGTYCHYTTQSSHASVEQKDRTRRYMTPTSNILEGLKSRGLIQHVFPEVKAPELVRALIGSPQTVYCGFDPTADSLHIGNLLSLIALLHCQRAGHQAIAVLGGATVQIGDPSGRTTERGTVDMETVHANKEALRENIDRVFANYQHCVDDGRHRLLPPLILDNSAWYRDVNVIDFLCSVGRSFRMGAMLSRQSVQIRLKSAEGMSLAEFMYQVFQAYDWLHLYRTYNCSLQIGGSDQLGNIVSGYELVTRAAAQAGSAAKPVFGLTTPLVTNTAGSKLGKTAGNAVWLDSVKTSPFDLFQYFVRIADSDVTRYLRLFTFLSDDEVSRIVAGHTTKPELRSAQTRLAQEVTRLVHGEAGLQSAVRCSEALYGEDAAALATFARLSDSEVRIIFAGSAFIELFLDPGTTVVDAVMRAGCFGRVEDAERVMRAGGVQVNKRRVMEPERVLVPGEHILANGLSVVRVGKKNYYLIRWVGF